MNRRNVTWHALALSWICLTSSLLTAQGQNIKSVSNDRRDSTPKVTLSQLQKENLELRKAVALLKRSYQRQNEELAKLNMSHQIMLSLLLDRVAVKESSTVGKVPTVQQALIKALEVSKTQRVFSVPEPKRAGDAPEYLHYWTVEVISFKQANGSVKVVFSRLPPNMQIKGRSEAGQKVLEVAFTKTGYKIKSYGLEPAIDRLTTRQEALFNHAVSVVCSLLIDDALGNKIVFRSHITKRENKSAKNGFSVVTAQDYPGETIYDFSKVGELVAISGGL